MIRTTIFPGRYIQGFDALKRLGKECGRFGEKGFFVCDPFVHENLYPQLNDQIAGEIDIIVEKFGGECSDEEIERLADQARQENSEIVAGLGGGKTLDTAKAVGHELNVPVAVIPTLASTDAPCSALAVIYTAEGSFKRYLDLPANPDLVLIDTKLVAQAPTRFLVSGMGDALATRFEAESAAKNYAANLTGDVGTMTAYSLAHLCYDTLLEYGVFAKAACKVKAVTPALDHVVEANTLLSGLGFESGGLAAAHAIHNGLTVLGETHKYYHGEKVAFGTLASLFLTDKPQDIIDEVYCFCEAVGLPTSLADIGLLNASDEVLLRAAKAACAADETIHNEPMPLNAEMVLDALKTADAYGEDRKTVIMR
jgi:glycerol dehydrogenase